MSNVYPEVDWTEWNLDGELPEEQIHTNQPTTHHPQSHSPQSSGQGVYLNHISPWSYNSPSPGPLITPSQHATPRLSPQPSTIGGSPRSEWAPSPGLMITTSQATSPAFSSIDIHFSKPESNKARLKFDQSRPRRSRSTSVSSTKRIAPLSTLHERPATFINPADLWILSGRTIPNLSREILAGIFIHYAHGLASYSKSVDYSRILRSGRYRLETLLLVCRHWHTIATQTSGLWEGFYIFIDDLRDFETWRRLARVRITRLNSHPDLSISIVLGPPVYRGLSLRLYSVLSEANLAPMGQEKAHQAVSCLRELADLVSVLAGIGNTLASVWRKFYLSFPLEHSELVSQLSASQLLDAEKFLDQILGREMKALEHIELRGLSWLRPERTTDPSSKLPWALNCAMGSLRVIHMTNCSLPCTPDIRSAQELRFDECTFWNDVPFSPRNIAAMPLNSDNAPDWIRILGLKPIIHLSHLHTLAIGPLHAVIKLNVPSLRVLEVMYNSYNYISSLFYLSGIIGENIEELLFSPRIRSPLPTDTHEVPGLEEVKVKIVSFFRRSRSIKTIRGPDDLLNLVLASVYELRLSSPNMDTIFEGLTLSTNYGHLSPLLRLGGHEDATRLQWIARQTFGKELFNWS
ncbi:hypothetical protein PIIN_06827 [Serendipita indica DSM 11827]|uniref:F-box domain-containing protein n=1 Tax=Serendipita indica (strain DSM 11827) TaxID=1109443 RepID=G4TNK3_SERID|nr:hypothetical protein PIIN_06827 [Serendipita indica DSM 11827]